MVLAIVLLLVFGSAMASPPTCDDLKEEMAPCLSYFGKRVSQPTETCCSGLKFVGRYLNDQNNRKFVCDCFRAVAKRLGRPVDDRFIGLPNKCGLSIRMPPVSLGNVVC
ncbi:probable non-specific lipid-transfer protein 3 [Corylus avellana]|uniref:probable non-specific lipid-transfer protein 3 n=1 Tax=Corylus avellana TaxID=13451 RepID=UPI00286D61E8|nr:probable non-specific lipid-transfer protein 3 [Corylus avellana]